jgi:hypothetical protein
MSSKWNIDQKNMVSVSLVFFSDVLSGKNMCHTCSVERYSGVVQVPLIGDFCYF